VSVFEFLLSLYAIVAGLGISLLVRSVGQLIEARNRVQLYWVHSCWLLVIFVAHVLSWFTLWQFARHTPWTVLQVLLMLCIPILLYLISHLAVPELEDDRMHDMRSYYYAQAHWTQALLLGALVISGLAQHYIDPGAGLSQSELLRIAVAALLVPGILSRAPTVHAAQAVLLLALMAFGVSYVSTPIG
jgi:hypothetical protein